MRLLRLTWLLAAAPALLGGCGQALFDGHDAAAVAAESEQVAGTPSPTIGGSSPGPDARVSPTPSPAGTPDPGASPTPTPVPTPTPTPTPPSIPLDANGNFAPSASTYRIAVGHTGRVLDLSGGSATNGTNVVQWTITNGASQHWKFVLLSNGSWEIVNYATQKCIDVQNNLTTDGTPIEEWDCVGQPNQQWTITSLGTDQFKIQADTGSCLDILNDSILIGTQAIERECNASSDQVYIITYSPVANP